MILYIMRHGIAEDRTTWQGSDDKRPLTPRGIERTQEVVQALHKLKVQPEIIASSPLRRARQTAEIVQSVFAVPLQIWPELENTAFDELLQRLSSRDKSTLLVGHEPSLSEFTSRLLSGTNFDIAWKKAAVCALDVQFGSTPRAELLWFAPPKLLRSIVQKGRRE